MHIAILGIGEVGRTLARDLLAAGATLSGWDPVPRQIPDRLHFTAGNPQAALDADLVLSTNLSRVAVEVAQEVLPSLKPGQVFADMNTASPGLKREIAHLFEDSQALFTDVAIMAPIVQRGIRTPMLASGQGAQVFSDLLSPCGAPISVLPGPAGEAATNKLLRSVFYKGVAAVVIETLEAASQLNLEGWAREQMLTILRDESMIDRFVEGSQTHAARRIDEMNAVISLLQELGVQPYSSSAARERLRDLLDNKMSEQ